MAIFSSTFMTRAKGSLGNITITTQKGRLIAKQKITIMRNPKTAGQVKQRKGMAIAVAMWRYLGGVIKSGITSYPQYGGQYNGFVSENIAALTNSNANPADLKNIDFVGIKATKGVLGSVNWTLGVLDNSGGVLEFPSGALKNIAQVGDKLKIVVGSQLEYQMGFFEHTLLSADLLSTTTEVAISGDFREYQTNPVFAAWVEKADGTASTSQSFVQG